MLIRFAFKNYASFKDETILDLSAAKISEYGERVMNAGGEKVLRVAAIYGANASGKSNVYEAFRTMAAYVISSWNYGGDSATFERRRPVPFLFDPESEHADTTLEVYFTVPQDDSGRIYNYGFSVGEQGVTEEWLNEKAKTAKEYRSVLYRDATTLEFKGVPKSQRENLLASLEKETLVVSLGAKLKVEKCKLVRDWFGYCQVADFANLRMNQMLLRRLTDDFVEKEEERQHVTEFLSTFDDQIHGFQLEKIKMDNGQGEKENADESRYKVETLHSMHGTQQLRALPLGRESAGTQKMFALYPDLKDVLERGRVFFIDELNARLHPLLVRNIILTFLNPETNKNGAQLLFTTHDTWQLSSKLLRRDEICFVAKNEEGESSLYSLADFEDEAGDRIRKDENYEKNYLLGKYGAIPTLTAIDLLKEE